MNDCLHITHTLCQTTSVLCPILPTPEQTRTNFLSKVFSSLLTTALEVGCDWDSVSLLIPRKSGDKMRLPFRIASRYHSGLATKLGLSSRSQVTSAVNVKLKPSESPPTIETISVSKGNPILKVKFSDGANGSYPLAWLRDLTKESVGLSWIATELEPIRIELVSNNCGINVFWPSNKEVKNDKLPHYYKTVNYV